MTAEQWQQLMFVGGLANLLISSGALLKIIQVAFMLGKMEQKQEDHDRRLDELEARHHER